VVNGSPGGGASSPLTIQIEGFPPDAVGVIDRANIGSDFSEANDNSDFPGVSGGGRFVVFRSAATNLVSDTAESGSYAFLRDTCTGAPAGCVPSLTRVSHSDYRPAISANGRYLGISYAGNIFLHDTCFGALTGCVPRDLGVDGSNADSSPVSLSADGRYAAYLAGCSPWDYGCDPGTQVFLADTCAGASSGCTPSSLAIAQTGQITEDVELVHPVLSPDGRFVIFNASDNDIWLFDSCGASPRAAPLLKLWSPRPVMAAQRMQKVLEALSAPVAGMSPSCPAQQTLSQVFRTPVVSGYTCAICALAPSPGVPQQPRRLLFVEESARRSIATSIPCVRCIRGYQVCSARPNRR